MVVSSEPSSLKLVARRSEDSIRMQDAGYIQAKGASDWKKRSRCEHRQQHLVATLSRPWGQHFFGMVSCPRCCP
jgi:hypothetical protein